MIYKTPKNQRDRSLSYYNRNREKVLEKIKIYYIKNRDKISIRQKEYRKNNKEFVAESKRIYAKNNQYKINVYRRNRIKNDIQFKLSARLRNRMGNALKRNSKSGSAVHDLGCTISELKFYLEGKFTDGMSWDNYGKWDIDHVIPLTFFDLTDRKQFLKACHYTNLQPMWSKDNKIKGNTVLSTGQNKALAGLSK